MKFYTIEVYKDANGEWRWSGKSRNGRVVADSGEGYLKATGLKLALRRLSAGLHIPLVVLSPSGVKWPTHV